MDNILTYSKNKIPKSPSKIKTRVFSIKIKNLQVKTCKNKIKLVTRTGFEPMNACVKGMCVQPLHQRAKKQNGGPGGT